MTFSLEKKIPEILLSAFIGAFGVKMLRRMQGEYKSTRGQSLRKFKEVLLFRFLKKR